MHHQNRPLWLFAAATLAPVPLIAWGALQGGWAAWMGLAYLAVFVAVLDAMITRVTPATTGDEFPAARGLTAGLALVHFALLGITLAGLSQGPQSTLDKAATFVSAALYFGQVSNANAHELIHRPTRALHRLGMWVYISLWFGHHTSAHPLVHHVHVATRADPSSARLGEGYYRFAIRAWRGSFKRGWHEETKRSQRINRPWWRHPYLTYGTGSALFAGLALLIGGTTGLALYLGLAFMAQSQLLMSDYVQHYGLTRRITDGKPEPVGPAHSWNSPHVMSSALTMNAPRHSDHHMRPGTPYAALTLPPDSPTLPRSLPSMAFIALTPPLWRRIMDPRAAKWQNHAPGQNVTHS